MPSTAKKNPCCKSVFLHTTESEIAKAFNRQWLQLINSLEKQKAEEIWKSKGELAGEKA